jgi:REP element-mobilizing transposase RayT
MKIPAMKREAIFMGLPRMNLPEDIQFVTNRCEHEMFFMVPRPEINALIKFWMTKAHHLKAPDLEIFAFCFLSNHFHFLVRDPKGQLASFMNYFQGNLATAINKKMNRRGKFWSREYDKVIVDGEWEFWDRYAYTTLNAVSANLVAHGQHWKGVSSYNYALNHTPVTGTGINWTRYNDARRHKKNVDINKYKETFKFKLATPPMLEGYSRKYQSEYLKAHLDTFTYRYRNKNANKPPLGMQKVLQQTPRHAPDEPKRRPRFLFMSFNYDRRKELKKKYHAFATAYKQCIHVLQMRFEKGIKSIQEGNDLFWPAGCYPPTAHKTIDAY